MIVFGLFSCLLPAILLVQRNGVSVLKSNALTAVLATLLFIPVGMIIVIMNSLDTNALTMLQLVLFKAILNDHLIVLCLPIIIIATHKLIPLIAHKLNIYSADASTELIISISLLLEWGCKLLFTDFHLVGYQLLMLPLIRILQLLISLRLQNGLLPLNIFKACRFVLGVYIIPMFTTILFYLQFDIIGFILIMCASTLWFIVQRGLNYE